MKEMKSQTKQTRINIGTDSNNETYYLSMPDFNFTTTHGIGSFGFESKHSFGHFDFNSTDDFNKFFEGGKINISESQFWDLLECVRSFETLESSYELYHRGGSHVTHNDLTHSLKDIELCLKLFNDMVKIVNYVCDEYNLSSKIIVSDKVLNKIKYEANPTYFIKNPDYPNKSKKEWILKFYNPLDDRTLEHYSKDCLIPKDLKKKLSEVEI